MRQISSAVLSSLVDAASVRLKTQVVRTPTVRLTWLDSEDREVYAKLECHQRTASFKYRGALNALLNSPNQQPFITASAGNHGLALAAAAQRLARESSIVVPVNASEIKVKRLQQYARVTLFGKDLAEATDFALYVSQRTGSTFVSPYADIDVAAGAGTAVLEAFQDEGPFDVIVVPLGGGGLAAGTGSWCKAHLPSAKLLCAHPAIFGRSFDSQKLANSLSKSVVPTVADGLAVQVMNQTPFGSILDEVVHSVIPVTEDEILQAVGTLIRVDSILVEGAAAAGLAAVSKLSPSIRGRVLILLTGGNISAADVGRALVTNVPEPRRRLQLGLRNTTPSLERGGRIPSGILHNGKTKPESGIESAIASWMTLLNGLLGSIRNVELEYIRKQKLSNQLGLEIDSGTQSLFTTSMSTLQSHAKELYSLVSETKRPTYRVMEERYRALLQCLSTLHWLLDRTSAANDQSRSEWFFNVESQSMTAVNYTRYGDSALRSAEVAVQGALDLGGEETELLLTSSGMAAYSLLEAYILRKTPPGTRCVLPPYIYFETSEQLQGLCHLEVIRAETFNAEELIATTEYAKAGIVFVDPVANNVQLSSTDIRQFAKKVCSRAGWEKRIVVIDGTLISGGMAIFEWFKGPHSPTVFYFESGTKYFQLGLDIQTAGAIVYPSNLDEDMRHLRRNMGLIMYPSNVYLLPPIDATVLQTRLARLSFNAQQFASKLRDLTRDIADINYPDVWKSHGWRHGGALVTICFHNQGLNNREGLDVCIELILHACKESRVPLVKGASFGFSTTRVSASSTMARDSDPFLRFSVGIDPTEADRLADITASSLRRYVNIFRP